MAYVLVQAIPHSTKETKFQMKFSPLPPSSEHQGQSGGFVKNQRDTEHIHKTMTLSFNTWALGPNRY